MIFSIIYHMGPLRRKFVEDSAICPQFSTTPGNFSITSNHYCSVALVWSVEDPGFKSLSAKKNIFAINKYSKYLIVGVVCPAYV